MEQNNGVKIQKIFSSAHFIVFSMRFTGVTRFFYLGRGKEFEGIFHSEINIASTYRLIDSFLAYLRAHLRGTVVLDIVADKMDRAVLFYGFQAKRQTIFAFFWRGRELFYISGFSESNQVAGQWQLVCSWKRTTESVDINSVEDIFSLFDNVGRKDLKKKNTSNTCAGIDEYHNFLQEADLNITSKKLKYLKRKEENIKGDINKFERWKKIFQNVLEDNCNLENLVFNQDGMRIKFNVEQSYYNRKSLLLDKLKKHKLYSQMAIKRLDEITAQILKKQSTGFIAFQTPVFNPMTHKNLQIKEEVSSKQMPEGVKFFIFPTGTLAIGLSAQGNDYIRSRWAGKSDFWFHLDGDRSPHGIWKSKNGQRPVFDEIAIIGSAISEYSALDSSEVNLVYTEVKNLKGVKQSPGKVTFKKEKRIRILADLGWQEKSA